LANVSFRLIVDGREANIYTEEGENILQAVTRAGVKAPRGCKNGNCFICEAELIKGSVSQSYCDNNGCKKFLPCNSIALEDSTLRFLRLEHIEDNYQIACQLISLNKSHENTWQLQLRLPAGRRDRINPASITMIKGGKNFPVQRAEIDQRILLLELKKDPALYLERRLAYIQYQLL